MDRVSGLRADYDRLGVLLDEEGDGSKAAALARERRMLGELLAALESPRESNVVDQLASRRHTPSADASPTSRRVRSRGG